MSDSDGSERSQSDNSETALRQKSSRRKRKSTSNRDKPPASSHNAGPAVVFVVKPSKDMTARLLASLMAAELSVTTHASGEEIFLLIAATEQRLEKEAGRIRFRKRIISKAGSGEQYRPFDKGNREAFVRTDPYSLFSSAERQQLILSIIGAKPNDGGAGVDVHVVRRKFDEKKHNLPFELSAGLVDVFMLHDEREKNRVLKTWGSFNPFKGRSITELRDYYGDTLGFYYAWLAFYTRWLFLPCVIGLAVFIAQVKGGTPDSTPFSLGWALFLILWGVFYLENWRRSEQILAHKWGSVEVEESEPNRPEFVSKKIMVDGEEFDDFPSSERAWRFLFSGIVVALCSAAVIAFNIGYLHLVSEYTGKLSKNSLTTVSIIDTLSILLFTFLYRRVAQWLNDNENHRTQTDYDDSLMMKFFVFEFINNYFMLFYIGFFKQGILFDKEACLNDDCLLELQYQLLILFLTKTTVMQAVEVLTPYFVGMLSRSRAMVQDKISSVRKHETRKLLQMNDIEIQRYSQPNDTTFDEFNEIVLQFGFLLLFAPALPLAAAIAWLNNWIEIRTDTIKMIKFCRRPVFRRSEDIGRWATLMQILLGVSIVTNVAICCFVSDQLSSRFLKNNLTTPLARWKSSDHWIVFVIMEHILLIVFFTLGLLIPDIPEELRLRAVRKAQQDAIWLSGPNAKVQDADRSVAYLSEAIHMLEETKAFNAENPHEEMA